MRQRNQETAQAHIQCARSSEEGKTELALGLAKCLGLEDTEPGWGSLLRERANPWRSRAVSASGMTSESDREGPQTCLLSY
jgi:hypothetical protein